jgi:hypothetical protein
MSWLDYLFKRREKIAEEKKTDEQFRAQIAEALLRQDDLLTAVAQMKKAREEKAAESEAFRQKISNRPPQPT